MSDTTLKPIEARARNLHEQGFIKATFDVPELVALIDELRRAAPEPVESDLEMAELILFGADGLENYTPTAGDVGSGINDVAKLAAEFAAVREEAEERGYSRGHDMGMDKAYGVSIPVNHKSFEQYLDEAREAATRAERERCAVIAGTFAEGENEPEFVHALKIEAAIRSGKGE